MSLPGFDRPEETFRQQLHADYKANREIPEEDMIMQIDLSREMLRSYGVHTVEKVGYEADDLLGTLVAAGAKREEESVIVSGDGDLLQLTVYPGVRVYLLRKGMSDFVLYDEKEAEKKNGYPVKYIVDYKGLAGDSSDNIAGVSGIGDVYAKRLITTFGDIDAIYASLDAGDLEGKGFTKRVITLLEQGRDSAFSSRELATIHIDVPITAPHVKADVWKDFIVYPDARDTLERYSFTSLLSRLGTITGVKKVSEVSKGGGSEKDVADDATSSVDGVVSDNTVVRAASVALWVLDATKTNAGLEDVCVYTGKDSPEEALVVIEERLKAGNLLSVWKDIEQPLLPVVEEMGAGWCLF